MDINAKHVLITGATRGVGRELTVAFAAAGANVTLVARSEPELKELAGELDGTAYPADLANPEEVTRLLGRIESEAAPVDILVNNAGVGGFGPVTEPTGDDVARLFQLNTLTPIDLVRQALPSMAERGGHIVSISSAAAVVPVAGMTIHGASKAALSRFTTGLRADLKGLPIGITLVETGPVPTDMWVEADQYRPTEASFARMRRLGIVTDTPAANVAKATVRAVQKGKRRVFLPHRGRPIAAIGHGISRIFTAATAGILARENM